MLVRKRGFLVADFARKPNSELEPPKDMPHVEAAKERPFQLIRSMLLYQLTGLDHGDAGQRASSESYHASLVNMARRWHLAARASKDDAVSPIGDKSTDERWRQWSSLEAMRRVAWLIHLSDFAVASRGISAKVTPLITFAEMCNIRLPCADMLWTAPDANSWAMFESVRRSDPSLLIHPAHRHAATDPADGHQATLPGGRTDAACHSVLAQ